MERPIEMVSRFHYVREGEEICACGAPIAPLAAVPARLFRVLEQEERCPECHETFERESQEEG